MHVFVETNYILELAFQQEDYLACERILAGAQARRYTLHVPHYALAEVFEVLRRKRHNRAEHQTYVLQEVQQHLREADADAPNLDSLVQLLINLLQARTQAQISRVFDLVARLTEVAPGPALTAAIVREAEVAQSRYGLEAQDALVWASVLAGLRELPPAQPKLLVTRNDSDFKKPDIIEALRSLNCHLIANFRAAADRLAQGTQG